MTDPDKLNHRNNNSKCPYYSQYKTLRERDSGVAETRTKSKLRTAVAILSVVLFSGTTLFALILVGFGAFYDDQTKFEAAGIVAGFDVFGGIVAYVLKDYIFAKE